jgi:hypothetical protein
MKANTKMLLREEWDFYNLDDQEVKLAFYYEYGRASNYVKNEVGKMRAARPPSRPDIWPYPAIADKHRLHEVNQWLAEQEQYFPETPWLTVRANEVAKINKLRAEVRNQEAQINATLPAEQKICLAGMPGNPGDPVIPIEWMVRALKGGKIDLRLGAAGFSHAWLGDPQVYKAWIMRRAELFSTLSSGEFAPDPTTSHIEGAIDWRAADDEIIEKFAWFLERERPAQFRDNAKTPSVQRGFDTAFPFRKVSALVWLGILRRFEAANESWQTFLELYDPEAKQKIDIGDKDFVTWRDNQMEKRDKALNVLNWFETGLPEYIARENFQ